MANDDRISKVSILIQQKKFVDAERILRELLSEDSSNIEFLALFAEVNLQQNNLAIAKNIINNAIGLSPDSSYLLYIKSRILGTLEDYKEAEKCINEAIGLNPSNADYFAWSAYIKLCLNQFEQALELANKALATDAKNLLGLNTRSSALLKLGKKEEFVSTIEDTLREYPNNAYTFANYAWCLSEIGNHKEALEYYKESLKQDPNYDYAKKGIILELKATNLIYKFYLKYLSWMSNLRPRYKSGVIIGFYVFLKVLKTIASINETLQQYLIPILFAFVWIGLLAWVIAPIGDFFLRFNIYGRLLLDKSQKMRSNLVLVGFTILFIGILLHFLLADEKFLTLTAFGFAMTLSFNVISSPSISQRMLIIYSIVMMVIGLLAIELTLSTTGFLYLISFVFVLSFIGFQFISARFLAK